MPAVGELVECHKVPGQPVVVAGCKSGLLAGFAAIVCSAAGSVGAAVASVVPEQLDRIAAIGRGFEVELGPAVAGTDSAEALAELYAAGLID